MVLVDQSTECYCVKVSSFLVNIEDKQVLTFQHGLKSGFFGASIYIYNGSVYICADAPYFASEIISFFFNACMLIS